MALEKKIKNLILKDPNFKPHELLVLCPNMQDYSPYLMAYQSIFSDFLPSADLGRVGFYSDFQIEIFIQVIDFLLGNFSLSSTLKHWELEPIQKKFGLDAELIKNYADLFAEIKMDQGINAEHLQILKQGKSEERTWEERIAALSINFFYGEQEANHQPSSSFPAKLNFHFTDIEFLKPLLDWLQTACGWVFAQKEWVANSEKIFRAKDWEEIFEGVILAFYITDSEKKIAQNQNEKWFYLDVQKQRVELYKALKKGLERLKLYENEDQNLKVNWAVMKKFLRHHSGSSYLEAGELPVKTFFDYHWAKKKAIFILGLDVPSFSKKKDGFTPSLFKQQHLGDLQSHQDQNLILMQILFAAKDHFSISLQKNTLADQNSQLPKVLRILQNWLKQDLGQEILTDAPATDFEAEVQPYARKMRWFLSQRRASVFSEEKTEKFLKENFVVWDDFVSFWQTPLAYYFKKLNLPDHRLTAYGERDYNFSKKFRLSYIAKEMQKMEWEKRVEKEARKKLTRVLMDAHLSPGRKGKKEQKEVEHFLEESWQKISEILGGSELKWVEKKVPFFRAQKQISHLPFLLGENHYRELPDGRLFLFSSSAIRWKSFLFAFFTFLARCFLEGKTENIFFYFDKEYQIQHGSFRLGSLHPAQEILQNFLSIFQELKPGEPFLFHSSSALDYFLKKEKNLEKYFDTWMASKKNPFLENFFDLEFEVFLLLEQNPNWQEKKKKLLQTQEQLLKFIFFSTSAEEKKKENFSRSF